jgi:hypothetical protein
MATTSLEVLGTIRADGTLELDEKLPLPPGRVKVRVEATSVQEAKPAEGLVEFVDRMRREMEAAGSHFMNDEEVNAWIEELRSEDDRLEDAYRQSEEERRQSERPGC